jgi:hypothetical protein
MDDSDDSELQKIFTTDTFFIIDYDHLIKKFKLTGDNLTSRARHSGTYRNKNRSRLADLNSKRKSYKSYNAYISNKFTDIIGDHLLPSYDSYLVITEMIRIIINYLWPLHGRQRHRGTSQRRRGTSQRRRDSRQFQPQNYTDINIPANAITVNTIKEERRELPFREVWLTGPFDVLLYYILELNKQLEFLSIYRIGINRALLDAVNKDLSLIEHKMIELYELYEPGMPSQYTKADRNRPVFKIKIPPLTRPKSTRSSPKSARLANNNIRPNYTRRRAKSI